MFGVVLSFEGLNIDEARTHLTPASGCHWFNNNCAILFKSKNNTDAPAKQVIIPTQLFSSVYVVHTTPTERGTLFRSLRKRRGSFAFRARARVTPVSA